MVKTPNTSSATTSGTGSKLRVVRRRLIYITVVVAVVMVASVVYSLKEGVQQAGPVKTPTPTPLAADAGMVLAKDAAVTYPVEQVEAISKQDYFNYTPKPAYAVTKTLIRYRSYDVDGTPIAVFARVYMPVGRTAAPIFGFAPGTTGIGDKCAPSLEEPAKTSWANYDSHMLTYAGQGYATVITDYEGMRDPARLHHYMVGALEGRAVLDSVRALINLNAGTDALDTNSVFTGGYSQGGHAAFWADQIASSYAPELRIKGVVGFGPVMDVQQTLADILKAANINWFGPYVLTSYADYYHDNYNVGSIILSPFRDNLRGEVEDHCIDTDLAHWGNVPGRVYTPEFLKSLADGLRDGPYRKLQQRLESNIAGAAQTKSAKLINTGMRDNVVLPAQQDEAMLRLCPNSRGPVELKKWPGASHYTTMEVSLADTLNWMKLLTAGLPVASTCQSQPKP